MNNGRLSINIGIISNIASIIVGNNSGNISAKINIISGSAFIIPSIIITTAFNKPGNNFSIPLIIVGKLSNNACDTDVSISPTTGINFGIKFPTTSTILGRTLLIVSTTFVIPSATFSPASS